MKALRIAATAILLLAMGEAFAEAPKLVLNYQGKLYGKDGKPVKDGKYFMTFRLWDDATSKEPVHLKWEEPNREVMTKGGVYSVLIGQEKPLDPSIFSVQLWLGVQVSGDASELSPRTRLAAVPYAARAAVAETLAPSALSKLAGRPVSVWNNQPVTKPYPPDSSIEESETSITIPSRSVIFVTASAWVTGPAGGAATLDLGLKEEYDTRTWGHIVQAGGTYSQNMVLERPAGSYTFRIRVHQHSQGGVTLNGISVSVLAIPIAD